MRKFDPDCDLDRETHQCEHHSSCALNDAHEYALWTFQCAVRDLMETHGYNETELAGLVIEAMPLAEEMDVELVIPADVPF